MADHVTQRWEQVKLSLPSAAVGQPGAAALTVPWRTREEEESRSRSGFVCWGCVLNHRN